MSAWRTRPWGCGRGAALERRRVRPMHGPMGPCGNCAGAWHWRPGFGACGKAVKSRRPVSRVLSMPCGIVRPFLCGARYRAPDATNPGSGAGTPLAAALRPCRLPLFGLAPGGVYPATPVARGAVRSYRTVSPLPSPFWGSGGLFSVALSLGSPPPAVSRHRIPVEPGLSSTRLAPGSGRPAVWRARFGRGAWGSQARHGGGRLARRAPCHAMWSRGGL